MSPDAPSVATSDLPAARGLDAADSGCHDRPMLRVAVRIAVTLFVIAATATACGAESRSSQRTSAPRVVNKYISKRYRYEIVLRGKYAMIPAQVAWNGGFPFGSSGQV